MKYRIKNWSDYQHYKDRCPPWLKLHVSLLSSEVWVLGNDATRALLIACMMLASRNHQNDGSFNGDPEYIKRFAYLNTKPDFKPLIEYGFIESMQDASTMLAKCDTEKSREETETDVIKKPSRKKNKTTIPNDFGISDNVANWALENGFKKLDLRLTHFKNACQAKGYEYADWDAAFRNAISSDWAKLGKDEVKGKFDLDEFMRSKL